MSATPDSMLADPRDHLIADLHRQLAASNAERDEALVQQAATAEVLQVINASPGDLAPVFDALLEKATRLCAASYGTLQTYDGESFRSVAQRGERRYDVVGRSPYRPEPGSTIEALANGESVVHVLDLTTDQKYRASGPVRRALVEVGGARTYLSLALRKDGALVGALHVYRQQVRAFTEKEIDLLRNFAAQAVIAMENARLLNELRDRTEELARREAALRESDDRYALVTEAAAEGIYDWAIGQNRLWVSARLIELFGWETGDRDSAERPSEDWNARVHPSDFARYRAALRAALKGETSRLVCEYRVRLISGEYRWVEDHALPVRDANGWAVRLVGAISDVTARKQAEEELLEALEQQTATAEVLQVINSCTGDLAPVFDAMLEKAMRLCEAPVGYMLRYQEGKFGFAAGRGLTPMFAEYMSHMDQPGSREGNTLIREGAPYIHIADMKNDNAYRSGRPLRRATVDLGGGRTGLAMPLRKDGELLGTFSLFRHEVRPFTEKQIALLQNFAAQAVIAMENARLLNEIRQRQAELRVTFDNMADGVAMFDEHLRLAAWNRNFQQIADLPEDLLAERPSYAEYLRILTERGELDIVHTDVELSRRLEHTDQELCLERTRPNGQVIEVRRNSVPDGGFVLIYSDITKRKRSEAEIRAARDAAEATLRDLRAAQSSLIQAQKMAALGQLTAGIAHEIKNPLNFVNNFAGLSIELLDELKESAAPGIATLDEDTRAEIDETVEMLTGNLDKIAEHGKRADGIVKSMLEHSRGVTGERREVDLNNLIEEAVNLAYHGARAQDLTFNITIDRDYDRTIGRIVLAPQEMTRVFLNLFGNGFYATTKRLREGADAEYRPTLTVSTRAVGDTIEVRVRDNGTGIPPEIRDKLFQPFFTTKPTGEGTGLGLSISYDIITQQHGGTITVDSEPGAYTEFTICLPRRAAAGDAA